MYELNISLNGRHHFATAGRSIDTIKKAQKIRDELQKIYSERDGYKICCTLVRQTSQNVDLPPTFVPPADTVYAVKRLIDSVWTLGFRIIDGKVEIISHDSDNSIGYQHEKDLPKFQLNEDPSRIVQGVTIGYWYFEVVNPQYVFSYSK
ncbi:hypothetical protein [Alishewanella phage vB_AspM_Slickus01]|nr:hypothetical protein [Alishewanella phage vB_AspM_Slickus01]